MGPTALLPFRRKACCGFFRPEKSNGFGRVRTRDLGLAVQTKQVRKRIHKWNNTKNTVQTIQNTINSSTHITKTNTHYKTHTYTNPYITKTHTYTHPHITKQVKTTTVQVTTTTVQDISKWNSHSTTKYPQYKFTLMYMALLSPRTSPDGYRNFDSFW
jgi:hypothetical protein